MLRIYSAFLAFLIASTGASSSERVLSAASRKTSLSERSPTFRLSRQAELAYSESSKEEGQETFTATLKVVSEKHILVIEEHEHLILDIECASNSISVTLLSRCAEDALPVLRPLVGGHVIVSHTGCNAPDEHQAYRVFGVGCVSKDTLLLQVTPRNLRNAFEFLTVELGTHTTAHKLRKQQESERLSRRQQDQDSGELSSLVPSIPVPTPTSVDTSAPTSIGVTISERLSSQSISLPTDVPLTLECNLCEVHGSIDLAWGQFDINAADGQFEITGYGTVVTNNLGGWFDLATNVSATGSFAYGLVNDKAQSASIKVPGLGAAAVALGPFLAGGFYINSGLGLTSYGLAVQVPDGSEIAFGVASGNDPTAAQVGFESAALQVLPWNAAQPIPEIDLWLAVRWTVASSFRLLESISGEGDIINYLNEHNAALTLAAYIDTPIINASVTANVDDTCNYTASGTTNNIRIDLRESLGIGAYFNEENSADAIPNVNEDYYRNLTLDGLAFTAGNEGLCLTFDAGQKRYTLANKKSQSSILRVQETAMAAGLVAWTFILFA